MSIEHIIATLRFANIAFLTGKISRHEARIALDAAISDYQAWSYRVSDKHKSCVEILSNNLSEALTQ